MGSLIERKFILPNGTVVVKTTTEKSLIIDKIMWFCNITSETLWFDINIIAPRYRDSCVKFVIVEMSLDKMEIYLEEVKC